MKRVVATYVFVFLVAAVLAGGAQAQWLPWNMAVDSSFRVGYLFGRQDFRFDNPSTSPFGRVRFEFNPTMPIFEGVCEISCYNMVSGRLSGVLGARGARLAVARDLDATGEIAGAWKVSPDVKSWEAAGLFHLFKGAGYRFSLVAGYRQEFWRYRGEPLENLASTASYREEFTSSIPFLAMQTAVSYPWWKASFEIVGSPVMSKRILSELNNGEGVSASYHGWVDHGGLIEVLIDGTVAVSSRMRVGIYARYTYVELDGEISSNLSGTSHPQFMYVGEDFATFGLDLSMIF